MVSAVVAAGLGLSTSGDRLRADLASYLYPRRILLFLDNFEQVIEAAPLVTGLLTAAPGLVALVTSRALLRLGGEHEFPVAPLAVPPPGADDAGQYDSVRLFVERAHAAVPGFELTDANTEAVAQICRRLDGLPLAIELAAARVRLLPPPALLARLDDRMTMLTGGARDLPERQRTLKNTLDWSFSLLPASERALFARLGVFAGPFGLRAAEAVSGGAGPAARAGEGLAGQVIETLGSLVDSSLIQPVTRDGEPRFGLLQTIREYARERLRHAGDWKQAHDRHAAYFMALAEPAGSELQGPGQLAWLGRLEAEHDDLRAALSWLVDTGQLEQAVRLAWVTWRFWWLHGHAAELAGLGEQIVAGSGRLPPLQRAMALALTGTGFTFAASGDLARAQALFEQSVSLYGQAEEKLGAALAAIVLGILGRLAGLRGDYPAASQLLENSRAALQQVGDGELAGYERLQHQLTTALVDNFSGQIQLSLGDYDRAAQLFTDGLSVARRAQDRISILISLYDLALSSQGQGDLTGAAEHLKEGLSLAAEAGDQTSAAYYLEGLAAVARRQDDPQRAVRLLAAARALLEASGSGWLHAYVPRVSHDDSALAALRSRMGDAAFDEAWAWGRSTGGRRAVEIALEQGNPA